jgi:hypothetical protein
MTPSAALAVLYEYREKLAELTDLSPQTARLRDEKSGQITARIQQYEQIAAELPTLSNERLKQARCANSETCSCRIWDRWRERTFTSPWLRCKRESNTS